MKRSRLYLDSNVYSFVASQRDQAVDVKDLLQRSGFTVQASAINVLEIMANPDQDSREAVVETLLVLADRFEPFPCCSIEATEFLNEVGRLRPRWLLHERLRNPYFVRPLTREHRHLWAQCRTLQGRTDLVRRLEQYRQIWEPAAATGRDQIKTVRERHKSAHQSGDRFWTNYEAINVAIAGMELPERAWRFIAMSRWYAALLRDYSALSDLAEWSRPYRLDPFRVPEGDFLWFWFLLADGERMPVSRVIGLTAFYQIDHKVTHGNSHDVQHAANIPAVTALLTSDRAFYQVLQRVRAHMPNSGTPLLIDRSIGRSASDVIGAALTKLEHVDI